MSNHSPNLFSAPPRENSGSTASNRFEYQKNWAICKLIELHSSTNDYLLALEFHDDIIVFDSSTSAQKVCFYQVKTNKSPNWTLNNLKKRKKSTKKGEKNKLLSSIFGKLYNHLELFPSKVKSLNFVTNNNVKLTLSNDTKSDTLQCFCCKDLCLDDLTAMEEALKEEFSTKNLKSFKDITFFHTKQLGINNHQSLAKAQLIEFIHKLYPEAKYNPEALYKTLLGEITRKNNYEHSILDFEELKKHKGISREDFQKYISIVNKDSTFLSKKTSIENRLNAEQANFTFIRAFNKAATEYEIHRMNYNDKRLISLEQNIAQLIETTKTPNNTTLIKYMNLIKSKVPIELSTNFSQEYIKAIILFKLYE